MMRRLLNTMRLQAALAGEGLAHPKIGLVSSYDPDNYCAKVRLMPEDVETGWLPIGTLWAGPEWGLFVPPPIDAQALVLFVEADPEASIIVCLLWSDEARPLSVPSGEAWMVHQSGSHLKFLNDGNVEIKAPLTTIDGELKVTGDITDNTPGNDVTVKALRDAYNAHKHGGVQSGGSQTAITDHPAT